LSAASGSDEEEEEEADVQPNSGSDEDLSEEDNREIHEEVRPSSLYIAFIWIVTAFLFVDHPK
jgi:hypothetical protein